MHTYTMYRCVAIFSGEDGGESNAIMNNLVDGHIKTIIHRLISEPHYSFDHEDVSEESFLLDEDGDDYFDHVVEVGAYRLGYDDSHDGSDMMILEKVYNILLDTEV